MEVKDMKKIKLFCFPYAGASSMMYLKLKKFVNEYVEICPIELSGRGARIEEKLHSSIEETVDDSYNRIKEYIEDGYSYAFLGYSMGVLIVYELVNKIKNEGLRGPEHIFMAAKEPPNVGDTEYKYKFYKLPDDVFAKEIGSVGGTPKEILENKDALDLFIPILRADYKLVETYEVDLQPKDLECNITVLGGKEDKFTSNYLSEWDKYTSKDFEIIMFEGGHFFINDNLEKFSEVINRSLKI
jgi:medium-chain acyl-[acyl-carrier-protein] hydrolase